MPTSAAGSNAFTPRATGGAPGRRAAEHGLTPVRRSAEHGFTSVRSSAEQGFTSVRSSAEHGFTLVELMVVVTVIGLASGIALWSLPDPRGRVVEEATLMAARARAAHDLAIVDSRPVSLWVTGGGYGFDQRIAGRWVPLADKPFRVASWAEGTVARLAQPQVRVTFDPTGLADRPVEVVLDRDGRGASVVIGADGSVAVDA